MSAVPEEQTADSKWCLVGNTLETVTGNLRLSARFTARDANLVNLAIEPMIESYSNILSRKIGG